MFKVCQYFRKTKYVWSFTHLTEFVIILLFTTIKRVHPLTLILPGAEIDDPFKDNPKWREFLLQQEESIQRLETLVDNVWTLIDSIPNPNPSGKTNLKESFVKFLVPDFIEFFREGNERLRDGNAFSVLSTAIGSYNMSATENFLLGDAQIDPINQLQLEWFAVQEAAFAVHAIFNISSKTILSNSNDFQNRLLEILTIDRYPLWSGTRLLQTAEPLAVVEEDFTLAKISKFIDSLFEKYGNGKSHLLRRLLTLLIEMKQSNVYPTDYLNYFCYGNNEFGVIPGVFDVIADAAMYMIMADMKHLIMNVYVHTINTFYRNSETSKAETMKERQVIWTDMLRRIQRKVKLPFFEGVGWTHPAGPVVFKCDLPPNNFLGHRGQWGRNISTGVKPNASPTFPYDPPSGPLKENGTVGYYDDRMPELLAVGFQHNFKGYIESELVLDPAASCANTCPTFKRMTPICHRTPNHCALYRNSHCSTTDASNMGCMRQSQCPHYAMNCRRTAGNIKICPSADPSRLYDWINFDGNLVGKVELDEVTGNLNFEPSCRGGNVTTAYERWEMENGVVLHTPRYCELCLCTCMTPFDSKDKEFFDLEPLISNVENGFIVSAVRFVKEGNTIRLAIEEGKPLVDGVIDEMTLKWIEKSSVQTAKQAEFGIHGFMRINFDLLLGEAGTVVTGIRFVHNETEMSLNLEIQTTPITWPENFPASISLEYTKSKWISASPNSKPREPLVLHEAGDPRNQKGPSMPDSVLRSYVILQPSAYETDLGQTVVPLFDAQPVYYYERRRWLRGIGIMHKGKSGSGGFVSPTIVPASPYKSVHFHPTPTNATILVV